MLKIKKLVLIGYCIYCTGSAIAVDNHTIKKHKKHKIQSQQVIDNSDDKVVLNFENSDIQTTIKAISQLSGRNFVVDPRVKGVVTIISDQAISKSDSYKVLETALRMQGFAVVEADGVIKVLPEADAKTYGVNVEENTKFKQQIGDQIVTKVFVIQHGSAIQFSNALRPLISQNSSITVYSSANALIITDYASNINRINKIIEQLTNNSISHKIKPTIIQLKYAIASEVLLSLNSYIQGGSSTGGGGNSYGSNEGPTTTITVDSTTNSLIIYSAVQSRVEELVELAVQLDKNHGLVNNNLHVVYLKNADAAHIADVLKVVTTGQDNPEILPSSTLAKLTNEPGSTMGSGGGSSSNGGSGNMGGFGGGGMSGGGRSSLGRNANAGSSGATGSGSDKNAPKIFIQAEGTTNSLIIQAPDSVYRNLRMIIDMLDIRRAQVMIEAMIVDVNTTLAGSFGVQWVLGGGNNKVGIIGAANYAGNGASLVNVGTAVAGATGGDLKSAANIPNEVMIGLVTGTVNVGGQKIPSMSVLADTIANNNALNILSRPTLITLDNEEARIMVGQNVGIPSGTFQNSAGGSGTQTNIARRDLGTSLIIKPLITQSGAIQLDLYQEDSKIDASANTATTKENGPSILQRMIRSTLLVDDGQIIAIGGMTQDIIDVKSSGVPILGSIPYLGWLFSWKSRVHTKENLVLFLRPVIIRNPQGVEALTNQRYNYIMDVQNQIQTEGNWALPQIKPITLDNQLPYNNNKIVPVQKDNITKSAKSLPIVDVRETKLLK